MSAASQVTKPRGAGAARWKPTVTLRADDLAPGQAQIDAIQAAIAPGARIELVGRFELPRDAGNVLIDHDCEIRGPDGAPATIVGGLIPLFVGRKREYPWVPIGHRDYFERNLLSYLDARVWTPVEVRIANLEFHHPTMAGIGVAGCRGLTIERCTFLDARGGDPVGLPAGIAIASPGLYRWLLAGEPGAARDGVRGRIRISRCVFDGDERLATVPGRGEMSLGQHGNLFVFWTAADLLLEKNVFKNPGHNVLLYDNTGGQAVRGNTFLQTTVSQGRAKPSGARLFVSDGYFGDGEAATSNHVAGNQFVSTTAEVRTPVVLERLRGAIFEKNRLELDKVTDAGLAWLSCSEGLAQKNRLAGAATAGVALYPDVRRGGGASRGNVVAHNDLRDLETLPAPAGYAAYLAVHGSCDENRLEANITGAADPAASRFHFALSDLFGAPPRGNVFLGGAVESGRREMLCIGEARSEDQVIGFKQWHDAVPAQDRHTQAKVEAERWRERIESLREAWRDAAKRAV